MLDDADTIDRKVQAALERGTDVPADDVEREEAEVGREYTFQIDMWSKMDREQRTGTFTNTILTPSMELKKGTIRSQLLAACGSNIDFRTSWRAEQIAHLSLSLTKQPKWFNPQTCEDKAVLEAIYEEVASHEARFWGPQEEPEIIL
jgi:hypothetical protein